MKFDEHFLEQVRNSVSIMDVVGDHLQLRKIGQNYVAICPFHSEKTPSFSVSPSKQIFKCFGCGIGGDVFRFLMEIEHLSFPEAVRYLAESSGISLPSLDSREVEHSERRWKLLAIMKEANQLFQDWLRDPIVGVSARSYLKQRQIDRQIVDRFGLGYAPGGNRLLQHLKRRNVSIEDLDACGLLKAGEPGQPFDKFRNRIMFPIRDLTGRVIAFGGRALGDARPKYLNSPDTALYKKGMHLYGLDLARDEIRKRDFAILVEGYFDCIVPSQFGFSNVVASLGTGLTAGQVKLLRRYTRKVIVGFDPDPAGRAAAMRSLDLFLQEGFQINVLQLPAGQDPDSFLLAEGADAYDRKLKKSVRYLDFVLAQAILQQKDANTPQAKQQVVEELLPYLAKVPNRIERAEHVAHFASRLRINEALLLAELRKISRGGGKTHQSGPLMLDSLTPAERNLLLLALEEECSEALLSRLDPELFLGLRSQTIFSEIRRQWQRSGVISILKLRERVSAEDVDLIDRLALDQGDCSFSEEIVQTSIQALRDVQLSRRVGELQREIEELEKRSGETSKERLNELLREKSRLSRERQHSIQ